MKCCTRATISLKAGNSSSCTPSASLQQARHCPFVHVAPFCSAHVLSLSGCCPTGHGGIRSILDDMKLLSTEAEGVNEAVPQDLRAKLVNEQGRVGALLGLKAPASDSEGTSSALTVGLDCSTSSGY